MDLLKMAQNALALAREGRQAFDRVRDAAKDGKAALSATDQAELDRLLAEEARESKAAHDSLASALDEADQRGDGAG